jgi:hypothetical protein
MVDNMNIIELGNKAGLPACHTTHPKALERFAELVAAQEREACAKICDDGHLASIAADIIRERNTT